MTMTPATSFQLVIIQHKFTVTTLCVLLKLVAFVLLVDWW